MRRVALGLPLLLVSLTAHADSIRIGPSFTCPRPAPADGLSQAICDNPDMSREEVMFEQAYYALRHADGKAAWKGLKVQAVTFNTDLRNTCGIPLAGAVTQSLPPDTAACYIRETEKDRNTWLKQMTGSAREEASRPVEQHIALQQRLVELGYLPIGTRVDGIYGETTRDAIKAWQHVSGQPQATGFISDADAQNLSVSTARVSGQNVAVGSAGQATGPDGTLHTVQTVYACANPRAAHALNNASDPRQSDPGWVAFVRSDGQCFEVTPDQGWERISEQGGLLLLRRTPPVVGEPPLFFRPRDIAKPAPISVAVASTAPLPANLPTQDTPQVPSEASATVAAPEPQTVVQVQPSAAGPVEQPETPAPAPPANNDSGGAALLILLIIVAAVIGLVVARNKAKQRELEAQQREQDRRRKRAFEIATTEIANQQRPLHVRRLQLVTADAYGTVNATKWVQEKEHFTNTRILPLLAGEGLSDQWTLISQQVDYQLDFSAAAPLAGDPTEFFSNPSIFDPRMTPIDYELHCALLLRSVGWDAQTTVASGDQGTDVIAKRNGKVLVVQCKLYSQSVGNSAVQEISAARLHQRADFAAVVSNAAFTPAAKQLARTNGVYLLHHDELTVFDPARVG